MLEYEAGRYDAAHAAAVEAMRTASGEARESAAYIAGVSAFQLERFSEAETRLLTAERSSDREVRGKATATLGLIRLRQGRPADAAAHFEEASRLLDGAEASEAAYRAALAHQQAGNPAAAQAYLDRTTGSAAQLGPGGFAIQVGAFQEYENARTAADGAERIARNHRLGEVRIVPRPEPGGVILYIVQFGRFNSRDAAERMRDVLGRSRWIVAPALAGS